MSHAHTTEAVSPLELFFDLVFAFGMSQLSHHLLAHLSWHALAETVVLLLATFSAWSYVSWAATLTSISRRATRSKLLVAMAVILFMNAGIGAAFGAHPWAFVLPFVLVQLGGTLWTAFTSNAALFRDHFMRTFVWLALTAPLWLLGAWTDSATRLWWWAAAAAIDLLGTLLAHPLPGRNLASDNVPFDWEHMLERGRLLFIIALGETVMTTGAAIADAPKTPLTVLTGLAALGISTALWAITFGRTEKIAARHLEEARNPIRASMLSINSLPGLLLGLVLLAVGAEQAVAHAHAEHASGATWLLFGGPLVVIATQGFYQRRATGHFSLLRLLVCGALLLVGVACLLLGVAPWLALVLVAALVGIFAVLDIGAAEQGG